MSPPGGVVLYVADRVETFDPAVLAEQPPDSVAVAGDRVIWIGSRSQAPSVGTVVDLGGATILPGFVDAHVHLTATGLLNQGPDLTRCDSREEMLDALAAFHRLEPDGVLYGSGWDDSRWPQANPPTMDDLDRICDGRPCYLPRVDIHGALVSTAMLALAQVRDCPGVERDREGHPSGFVVGRAHEALRRVALSAMSNGQIRSAQQGAAKLAASRGVVEVHEMGGPDTSSERDLDLLLAQADSLPVGVVAYYATNDLGFVLDRGLRQIGGDLFVDGSLGSRTAAMREAYADGPGTGDLHMRDDDLVSLITEATRAGLQLGLHAIGDAALDQALHCFEQAVLASTLEGALGFVRLRHRIEHLECVDETGLKRMAMLGLAASMQPGSDSAWGHPGGLYESRLGTERSRAMNPLRSVQAHGIPLGFGSDSPVTPLDPWGWIGAAVAHHDPSQALSVRQAIVASSQGGRSLGRAAAGASILRQGAVADFAAFAGDPVGRPPVAGTKALLTVRQGIVTHRAPSVDVPAEVLEVSG
ncbi:MAG: amidohydrolase [Actinomycetota bacterium]